MAVELRWNAKQKWFPELKWSPHTLCRKSMGVVWLLAYHEADAGEKVAVAIPLG
jgi:hypothetical protein